MKTTAALDSRLAGLGLPLPRCDLRLAPDTHLSLVTTVAGLAGLEAGWRDLEASESRPCGVFQTFDWVKCWVDTYTGASQAPVIVAGHRAGRLVFVWPLVQLAVGPTRILRWLSEPLAQYGDILIASDEDAGLWCEAARGLLAAERAGDIIWLRHVREDATITPHLSSHFQVSRFSAQAPWLDLSAFANEAAYDARYTSNQRKRRKKIRKALEDDFGPVSFDVLPPGDTLDAAIVQAVREKSQWVDDRGRRNSILGCPRLPRFLSAMSYAKGSAKLVATCLRAGGQPVSWELGLRYGKSHFAFITSHVNSLTDYSAARLHMDQSQRLALRDGLSTFDLMVPNDEYKASWSSAVATAHDYHLPLTATGWVFGRLYLEAVRPALRTAYYNLPQSALRALKPVIGH